MAEGGCGIAASVGAAIFAFSALVVSLGDCMSEVDCRPNFWLATVLPTLFVAAPVGFGVRWLMNCRAIESDPDRFGSSNSNGVEHSRMSLQRKYLLQICFVGAVTTLGVLLADALAFRAPANAVWMIGLPIAVGMIANDGWRRRCIMAVALLSVSIVAGVFIGVNFTSYG